MSWKELLANLQREIQQHTLGTFPDGTGPTAVVVTGCPTCRKKFQTINQLVRHITDEGNCKRAKQRPTAAMT
jgi:hypothetical protein